MSRNMRAWGIFHFKLDRDVGNLMLRLTCYFLALVLCLCYATYMNEVQLPSDPQVDAQVPIREVVPLHLDVSALILAIANALYHALPSPTSFLALLFLLGAPSPSFRVRWHSTHFHVSIVV
jgi:hypothetical protein